MAHHSDVEAVFAAFGMSPMDYRTFPPAPATPSPAGAAAEDRAPPAQPGRRGWSRADVARPIGRPDLARRPR